MIYFLIFINCGNIAYIFFQHKKVKSERKYFDIDYVNGLINKALSGEYERDNDIK